MRRALRLLAVLLALLVSATAVARGSDEPRVHTVYRGQRLGSIAKRYHVSVDALCHANDIRRSDPIHPGQKLIVPAKGDKDGSEARKVRDEYLQPKKSKKKEAKRKPEEKKRAKQKKGGKLRVHTVYRGQRLGSIAKRYHVSVDALCHANDIRRTDAIHPGQKLVVPASDDEDGSRARALRDRVLGEGDDDGERDEAKPRGEPSWKKYEKPPWRRGYITLIGRKESWKGYVIGPGNRVLSGARKAVSRVLTSPEWVDQRLVRLLAQISDTFGGRNIRVVSGFRKASFAKGSRHRQGKAIDFAVDGVPNTVLRDYLLTLRKVGVGYYPNSSFVHLDSRSTTTYWVDYSGPGEPPQYGKIVKRDDGDKASESSH